MVTAEQLLNISMRPARVNKRRWLTAVVCVLVVMLVSIRFFTERVPILPRFINPIDLLIVPLLSPFWLIWISFQRKWKFREVNIIALSGLTVAAWGLSWLI